MQRTQSLITSPPASRSMAVISPLTADLAMCAASSKERLCAVPLATAAHCEWRASRCRPTISAPQTVVRTAIPHATGNKSRVLIILRSLAVVSPATMALLRQGNPLHTLPPAAAATIAIAPISGQALYLIMPMSVETVPAVIMAPRQPERMHSTFKPIICAKTAIAAAAGHR